MLLQCPVFEVFFGGARGGGKTDGALGDWVAHAHAHGKNAIGWMGRRTLKQLTETIERSKQIYGRLSGWTWREQDKTWISDKGARLKFAYLERDQDADEYQGHSYTRVYFEELTNFPSPVPVLKMMATLRSGAGVPCGFRATGNPGGAGHNWVKERYITPCREGLKVIRSRFTNPFDGSEIERERVFIPSRLSDNRYLGADYVANLQMSGSDQLVRAWLEGDWDVVDGSFFDKFSCERHVLKPFSIPDGWMRFRAMDWGSARPFSVGWYAVASDDYRAQGRVVPRGALVKYREWYGSNGQPNVGLKLTASAVGCGIAEREAGDDISYGVLDPAAFAEDGGPSIAEVMRTATGHKVIFKRADNTRVARNGAISGWDAVRQRLDGDEDGNPRLFFFETCRDSIRTIPTLQHDSDRPEDLDSDGEDHAADELRYACLSRPWVSVRSETRAPQRRKMFDAMPMDDAPNWRVA